MEKGEIKHLVHILQLVKMRGRRRADEDSGRECNTPLWSGPGPGGRVGLLFFTNGTQRGTEASTKATIVPINSTGGRWRMDK